MAVGLIRSRSLQVIDYQNRNRALCGYQLEPELLL